MWKILKNSSKPIIIILKYQCINSLVYTTLTYIARFPLIRILLYDTRRNHFSVTVIPALLWRGDLQSFGEDIFFLESYIEQSGNLSFLEHFVDITVGSLHVLAPGRQITVR